MAESVTRFGAVDENFSKTIQQMEGRLDGFTQSVDGVGQQTSLLPALFTNAAITVAAFAASVAGAVMGVRTFRTALDFVGKLDALQKQTNLSRNALLVLERAFINSGVSADRLGTAVGRVQTLIGQAATNTGKAREKLAALGLQYEALKDLKPEHQFEAIMHAIGSIEDPTRQAAAATAIFQQQLGRELLPLAKRFGEETEKAWNQLGSLPAILRRFEAPIMRFRNNVTAINELPKHFAVGFTAAMSEQLAELSSKFTNFDAAGLGFAIGSALNNVLTMIRSWAVSAYNLLSGVWDALQPAAMPALNRLGAAFSAFAEVARTRVNTIFTDFANFDFTALGNNLGLAIAGALKDPGKFFDFWWAYMDLKAREFANLLPSLIETGLVNNQIMLDSLIESGSIERISDLLYNAIVLAGTKGFEKWTDAMMTLPNIFEGLWSAVVDRSSEKLRASISGALDGSLMDFLNGLNPVQAVFNKIAQQFGTDLGDNVKGSAAAFREAYDAEGGNFTDKFWAGWREMGSQASQDFAAGLQPAAESIINAGTLFAERATVSKVEMFDTRDAANEVAQRWADLTQNASTLPTFSGQVLDDLSQAELKVSGQSGISPALDANASALNQTAASTQAASQTIAAAYSGVSASGQQFSYSAQVAGTNFGNAVTQSGHQFAASMNFAIQELTSSVRGFATEATLQKAVNLLESLNTKLPQPVLV